MKYLNKKIVFLIMLFAVVILSALSLNIIKKDNNTPEMLRASTYAQVQPGDESIDETDYVTFDAFYLRDLDGDGYAEKIRGTCKEIGTEDTLYMDLNVLTNGTLKNGKITIDGKNFNLTTSLIKDDVISQDYISNNTKEIILNDVVNGTQKLIFGIVKSGDYVYSKNSVIGNDTKLYSVDNNTITLTGTHVSDEGVETPINKTIILTNDWYGTTRTKMSSKYKNQEYDILTALDEENNIFNLNFKVNSEEKDEELILYKNHVEGELPLIGGYAPSKVSITNSSAKLNYDNTTRMFTIEITSKIDNNGIVTSSLSRSLTYDVLVEYPIEAYRELGGSQVAVNIPIKSWYEGYNNTNNEFINPYRSNTAEDVISIVYKPPVGEESIVDVIVGKYVWDDYISNYRYVVSKELPLDIYNQVSLNPNAVDRYNVKWYVYVGTNDSEGELKILEKEDIYTDRFVDTDGQYIDMEKYVSNVGIYFSNPIPLLGEEGYINVYNDETGELIHTFTNLDWNKYSSSNPYMYSSKIKHIRVETSVAKTNQGMDIFNVKEIDDNLLTADFTEEEFNSLCKIYSYVRGYIKEDGEYKKIDDDTNLANYEAPYSFATISVNPEYISNNETQKGVLINIDTVTNEFNTKKWKNGEFLLKYPKEIIDVNIISVSSKDSNVEVTGVETYEEEGYIYTKIYTSSKTERDINLELDLDITADPREATISRDIELYYYNPICNNYSENARIQDIYDINGDENREENIGYMPCTINIIAPSNLLTSQMGSEYDKKGSVVIAPQTAIVEKVEEETNATVNVNVTNNYSGTISEIKVVGKIPFEGNTYQINGGDLGSTYSTTMTVDGILIPEEIKDYATVYYSYNENVTDDLNDLSNGWTTLPNDYSMVKTYLIDLSNYVMPKGTTQTFSYTINIPSGLEYNDVAFSDHAVYYYLDTDEGKLKTQTEPNKLGFMIAERFDLEITKYEKNSEKVISGVTFIAEEVGAEDSKIATTYNSGIATLKNLYVEREYKIKEIKTNDNYILDNNEIIIIGHIIDNNLEIELKSGNFKNIPVIENVVDENDIVKVVLENEVKYNLELSKTSQDTNQAIQGIKFEISGNDETTRSYITNENGRIIIKLLEPNVQYTLKEVDSKGYYLKEPITFKMIRNENGNLEFNVINGEFETVPQIDASGEIPVVRTGLLNEKVPTYSLKIKKTEKDTDIALNGTQFKITGENKEDIVYTTDKNGYVTIDNLYEYVDGKNATGIYTLQEIYPSEGYVLIDEPIVFRCQRDENGELKFEIISGRIKESSDEVFVDNTDDNNPIVNITIENEPIFTLTKVDADTNEPLAGVEFKITDMDGNYVSDVNGNIVGEYQEKNTNLVFSTNDTNGWIELNNVWQSGNINQSSTSSILESNEFALEDNEKIYFEWTVSSENENDYLYYTIINVDTGNIIGGENTKISGTSYGTEYNSLKYINNEITLSAGKYKIEFRYVKNETTDSGLDKGYIKNIKLLTNTRVVKTDEKGKIRLSLGNGLYKAEEVSPLEGYMKPELYTGIGIGESKQGKTSGRLVWENRTKEIADFDVITTVLDGAIVAGQSGEVAKFDLNGNCIWMNKDVDVNYNRIITVSDGVIAVGYEGTIAKYDFNGNLLWIKYGNSSYVYYGVVCVEDGYIAAAQSGEIVKYDFDGNVIWEKTDFTYTDDTIEKIILLDDGIISMSYTGNIVKYNLDGDVLWQKHERNYEFYDMLKLEDGFVAVGNSGVVVKYDFSGSVQWENSERSYSYRYAEVIQNALIIVDHSGRLVKYDFNGTYLGRVHDDYYDSPSVTVVEGGLMLADHTGRVMFYDYDLNQKWINTDKTHNNYGIAKVSDGVIVADSYGGLIKYDFEGNVIWENEKTWYSYENLVLVDDGVVAVSADGQVVKYDFNGNIVWQNTEKDYDYRSAVVVEDGIIVAGNGGNIVKYDSNGNVIWDNSDRTYPYRGIALSSDGVIAVASFGQVAKYDFEGNLVWENIEKDYDYEAAIVADNAIFAVDWSGRIAKYDLDGNFLWRKRDGVNKGYYYRGILPEDDGVVVLEYRGQVIKYDFDGNVIWECTERNGNNRNGVIVEDGYITAGSSGIAKYQEYLSEPEIPASQNVIVENQRIAYKITTEVIGGNGTILGEDESPYEIVKHGNNSIKDIIVTPNDGYKVSNITINGEAITFTTNDDGTVELSKFINMTSDKHVVVQFSNTVSDIIVHHYIKDTTTSVADDEYYTGNIGEKYVTSPKMDLLEYELVKNDDGSYKIPDNATGTYTDSAQEITYYYELKPLQLIVHHYIDGTEDSIAPDENSEGTKGQEYTTTPAVPPALDERYEVINSKIPENANGTLEEPVTIVTYYYTLVKGKVTVTKVDKDDANIKLADATFKIEKIDSEGNVDETFTTQEKTTGSEGTIEFTELLVGKYRITETKAPIGYELAKEPLEFEITRDQKDLSITATDKLKLELPETGAKNHTIITAIIGLSIMISSILLSRCKSNKKIVI